MSNNLQLIEKNKKKYLIIEDENDIALLLKIHLSSEQIEIVTIDDGKLGLAYALEYQWDLIILDLQLPSLDGLEICKSIRLKNKKTPILMLTSRASELDEVIGLDIGADDYISKPFSIINVQARIKALLRRTENQRKNNLFNDQDEYHFGQLIINRKTHNTLLKDKNIDLTAKEFELLWFLASNSGTVFKRFELLDSVWGYGHEGYEHTVNSHINRLRSKIELDPANPAFIITVWSVGYKFNPQIALQ